MFLIRLVLIALLLVAGTASAQTSQTSIDLIDLTISPARIPEFYPFVETVYDAAQSWTEYDISCASAPCDSGKTPYTSSAQLAGCSTVNTGAFNNIRCHIQNALDNTVLYLHNGTYSVNSGSGSGMLIDRSNIVIRGNGPTNTIFSRGSAGRSFLGGACDANTGAMIFSVCKPGWSGSSTSWTAGRSTGTTVVTVGDASLFTVGGWIRLRMSGSTSCSLMDKLLNAGDEADGFVHIAKVTVKNGSQLTIDRALRLDYGASGCTGHEAVQYSPVENFGIEKIRFTSDTGVPVCSSGTCIKFPFGQWTGATGNWVVGSQFDRAYEMWTHIENSARNWIQGNKFDNLDESISFNTEGIYVVHGSVDNVFENNICKGTRVCQKIDNGAEGTVTAYNYMRQSQSLCERAYFNHGHYVRESLFEGNDVDCEVIMADKWWGRNGHGHTAYRNRNVSNVCHSNRDMITLNEDGGGSFPAADYVNIIGNTFRQIGTSPVQSQPPCPPSINVNMTDLGDHLWLEKNAWRLAGAEPLVGNDGTQSCGVSVNDSCPGTNLNVLEPDASWNGTYPTSLYHTSVPSWWCEEACLWSQGGIGAFGDDFTEGATLCKLPAQIRDEGLPCTTGAGTPTPDPPASGTPSFEGMSLSHRINVP